MRWGFLRSLQPRWRYAAVTDIPSALLADADLVVLDIDNTLVIPETIAVPKAVETWVRTVAAHGRVLCVSNSGSIRRRQAALEALLGCTILRTSARKPFRGVWTAVEALTSIRPSTRTLVIGDRLFSDILLGNWAGARTILVEPLSAQEARWIRLVRCLERLLLRAGGSILGPKALS